MVSIFKYGMVSDKARQVNPEFQFLVKLESGAYFEVFCITDKTKMPEDWTGWSDAYIVGPIAEIVQYPKGDRFSKQTC